MTVSLGRLAPQGAPRGLLVHWMLRRISLKPTYGFEILNEIEAKTEGAWRPGPGSVYPLLKKMVSLGYVESDTGEGKRTDQRLYKVTKKGAEHLRQTSDVFKTIGKRWSAFRGILVDMIEPDAVPDFLLMATRRQFELAKQMVELHRGRIPDPDMRSMFKEYSLLLENQRGWVGRELREAKTLRRRAEGIG